MSKMNCSVTEDLMPLYVDKVLSDDSVALVEEHLAECEACREKAAMLQKDTVLKSYDTVRPMRRARKYLSRHRIALMVVAAAALLLCVGVCLLFHYLTMVEIPYSYDEVKDDLRVVSVSDITAYRGGTEMMLLYGGSYKNYDLTGFAVPVGHRNGRMQMELTCYMTTTAERQVNPLSNWNFYAMRYKADPALTDIVYWDPDLTFSNTFNDRLYNIVPISIEYEGKVDPTEKTEVVRLYYGLWDYEYNEKTKQYDISLQGDRHLLWEKK